MGFHRQRTMWLWRNPDNVTHRQLLFIDQVWRRSTALTWSRWGCRRLADNIWLLAHDNNNIVLLFIRAPFYVLLVIVAMCSVFWLFWLSCQYLPSDWLERVWGILIVARGLSPESPVLRVRVIFLVYCIASLFYYVFVLSPAPTWYIFLLLWRRIAYLCWKCC